jgi:non-ribosomal peptide synthetase-like protein
MLLPGSLSVILASFVYLTLERVCAAGGPWLAAAVAPLVILTASLGALALTVTAKWLIIGRYRPCERPFWSSFVWRDEIINSCQEQLAGAWLLNSALATPLMNSYLRAMGARIGPDVWCETLAITEFDLVDFGEGCAVNRRALIDTHLVHDRLMRLGPTRLEPGATLGPHSAVLPDTTLGAGCSVGGRSVVMRGEQLPARTRWHGAPVIAA